MKPSEQLRELVAKWKSWIGSDTFENSMGCGNEGDVYSAGSNDFLRRNLSDLESLIPAVEQLEQAHREMDAELFALASKAGIALRDLNTPRIVAQKFVAEIIQKLEARNDTR